MLAVLWRFLSPWSEAAPSNVAFLWGKPSGIYSTSMSNPNQKLGLHEVILPLGASTQICSVSYYATNGVDSKHAVHTSFSKDSLCRSWAKGGRGTCALLYDWERNYLEGFFDTHFVCPRTGDIRFSDIAFPRGLGSAKSITITCLADMLGSCLQRFPSIRKNKPPYNPFKARASHSSSYCRQHPFGTPNKDFQKRTVGGPLEPGPQGQELQLRIFLDGSCLEVFTDTGAALTTRVYR